MQTDTVELPKPDTHCHDEDTGKDVWSHSPEQMREYAAQVAAAEYWGLISLLADIRKAAGDAEGRLMQSELVAHITALRADAERYRWLRNESIDYPYAETIASPWCVYGPDSDAYPSRPIDREELDAAVDAARAAK